MVTLFLQSAENSSPNCGPCKCQSRSSLSRTHSSNGTMTPCAMVSTGGWLQLCFWPNSHSCAPPASRLKECSEETHTARPEMSKLFLLWMQTDPGYLLGWAVVCQPKEHITDKKQMGKRNQRNTTHGPGFSDTTTEKHLNVFSSCPSEGHWPMGEGILNQADSVQILAVSTSLQWDLQFP